MAWGGNTTGGKLLWVDLVYEVCNVVEDVFYLLFFVILQWATGR